MTPNTPARIAQTFIGLSLEQRRQFLAKLQESGKDFSLLPIVPSRHSQASLPLSYAQQRLLFLWQMEPHSAAYNMAAALRLTGELDEARLQAAFDGLLQRHEALRTVFHIDGEQAEQRVLPAQSMAIERLEVSEAQLPEAVDAEVGKPFDLIHGPLLRAMLFRLSATEHVLLVCMHHIVSDGWSMDVMVREFVQLYQQGAASLPALPVQYADYALWQRRWLEAGEGARQLAYWREQLGDEHPLLEVAPDFPRPPVQSYAGATVRFDFGAPLSQRMHAFARSQGVTLFMLTLAGYGLFLARHSGQHDIRIGVPNANRGREEVEGLIGFFINTQVLRCQIDLRQSFSQLLAQVRDTSLAAQAHQQLPFEQLVEALQPERSLGHNPLFQAKFNQNVGMQRRQSLQLPGLSVAEYPLDKVGTHFDLALDITDSGASVLGEMTYASDLYQPASIDGFIASLRELFEQVLAQPDAPLLSLVPSPEPVICRDRSELPLVLQRWDQQVDRQPNALAAVYGEMRLSYAELDSQANRLAAQLQGLGVRSGMPVAVLLERSMDWLVSLLATLKVGAVYMPLDTKAPTDRLAQMLERAEAKLVVLAADDARHDGLGCPALRYAPEHWQYVEAAEPVQLHRQSPAYVIHTSGSTGQPKGVVVSHDALASYVDGVLERLDLPQGASMALVSTIAADLGHTLVFGALCSGRPLHVLEQELAFDPDRFAAYMAAQQIAVLKIVPSHLNGLLQAASAADVLPSHTLIMGGEACSQALYQRVRALKLGCRVINHYGPSETTVGVLTHVQQGELEQGNVPLGTALPGAHVYVLDDLLNPVPERVAGELYIGGASVAQGYLGQAALTAERFVPDPYGPPGARVYRSGDRVRRTTDGLLHFLGRTDDQVKIRGYRVEPGEVAKVLRQLPGIDDAAVLAVPVQEQLQLVAYCVGSLNAQAIKEQLQAQLSDYLVPAHIVLLEQLPLTANGKLDRRALPGPQVQQASYAAPTNEVENTLAAIWQDVLKVAQVGVHDNFFELGGDSILSLQIIARAKRQGLKLTPRQLFEKQTIAQLAQVAKAVTAKVAAPLPTAAESALLPVQQRFFELALEQPQHYNQAVLLQPRQPLSADLLSAALQGLQQQHEALRFAFQREGNRWLARARTTADNELLWQRVVADSAELTAIAEQAQRSLDLHNGPLLRAVLFTLADGSQRLLLVIHHLVVDGVSWRVLLEDLQALYSGQTLEPAPSQQHWAERLSQWTQQAGAAELNYWVGCASRTTAPSDETLGAHSTPYESASRVLADSDEYKSLVGCAARTTAHSDGTPGAHSTPYESASRVLADSDEYKSLVGCATHTTAPSDGTPGAHSTPYESASRVLADSEESTSLVGCAARTTAPSDGTPGAHSTPYESASRVLADSDEYKSLVGCAARTTAHSDETLGAHSTRYESASRVLADSDEYKSLVGCASRTTAPSDGTPGAHSTPYESASRVLADSDESTSLVGCASRTIAHSDETLGAHSTPYETLPGAVEDASLRIEHGHSVYCRLNAEQTRQLLQQAPTAYRTQVNDLLLTALARTLCQWSGQGSALVQIEGHGREGLFDDVDLSRSVGWFTSLFPLTLTPSNDLAESIQTIKEQLRAVPNKGVGFGTLRYLGDAEQQAALAALPQPRVTFNYLGQFDQSFAEDGLFALASESVGAMQSEHNNLGNWLSINGQVLNGELELGWTFSREMFGKTVIADLAEHYLHELQALIAHCLSSEAGGATPSDFPLAGFTQAQLQQLPFDLRQIEAIYPLSPMQEGLLLHTLLEPGSGIYMMQYCYSVDSAIDTERFRQAWQAVAQRHDALRTRFSWGVGERMVQVVQRIATPDVQIHDWRDIPASEHERTLLEMLAEERRAGFDLQQAVPFRLRLIQLDEQRFGFVLSNHHILIDAWCRSLLMDEFFALYAALAEQRPAELAPASRYGDFIAWLQQQDRPASERFWREQLAGFEQPTSLPFDRQPLRDASHSLIGDCQTQLDREQTRQLQATAQQLQLTVNTLVQAAWALVLHRYSGARDVLFGVTVAGRPVDMPEMQRTVGLFINSIALRVQLPEAGSGVSVGQWLQQLFALNLRLREHEHLPLVDIQACSEIGKGQPLFDSLFVFENAPMEDGVMEQAQALNVTSDSGRTHTNYPMTVVIYPGEALGLHLSYDQRWFDDTTVQQLLADFHYLLLQLAKQPQQRFDALPLLAQRERQQLLHDFNQSTRDYPLQQGYALLFEQQAALNAERVAASFAGEQWNYRELDQQANRMAQALLHAGVQPDQPVALLAERGLPLLGMIVGTLKAAAGYLPLDPHLPAERLRHILTLSRAPVLVCTAECVPALQPLLAAVEAGQRPQLVVWEQLQQSHDARAPELPIGPRHLAYVIYTSGSTGLPKGVMVEQAGMLNNQLSKLPYLHLSANDVIAQTASQSFDISVWQFLTAALCGARVEIVPDPIAHDPQALLAHVNASGISVLESVPSLIQGMLDGEPIALPGLRWLLTTGEAMPPELARRWLQRYPHIPLINAYGPAECSDDVSLTRVSEGDCASVYLPIGLPTDNNKLHVLDGQLELVGARAVGELCVSGTGVGRGYVGDPVRTALAFVPDPYASEPGQRLYRTGDLARRRSDGVLEYVGRRDHQVKIRGFRIELGEIEARLSELPGVRDSAVLAQDQASGRHLVAYVVPSDTNADEQQQRSLRDRLKTALKRQLPDYMVPQQWVLLDSMPLNANGKLDRKVLATIESQALQGDFAAPQSELEMQLAQVWQELLHVERVGRHDNFFELGGHSLLLVRVISRLKNQLGIDLPMQEFYRASTVAELAAVIDSRVPVDDFDTIFATLDELEAADA